MNTKKELMEKALNYMELIMQSKRYQKSDIDFLGMAQYDDFLGLKEFRRKRVKIHDAMQKKMINRVDNLLKQAINEN